MKEYLYFEPQLICNLKPLRHFFSRLVNKLFMCPVIHILASASAELVYKYPVRPRIPRFILPVPDCEPGSTRSVGCELLVDD